jgi:hypothetical protein
MEFKNSPAAIGPVARHTGSPPVTEDTRSGLGLQGIDLGKLAIWILCLTSVQRANHRLVV